MRSPARLWGLWLPCLSCWLLIRSRQLKQKAGRDWGGPTWCLGLLCCPSWGPKQLSDSRRNGCEREGANRQVCCHHLICILSVIWSLPWSLGSLRQREILGAQANTQICPLNWPQTSDPRTPARRGRGFIATGVYGPSCRGSRSHEGTGLWSPRMINPSHAPQQPAECLFSQYVLYYTCPTIVIIIFECVLGVNHHAKYFIYIVSFNPHHSLGRQVLLSELYRWGNLGSSSPNKCRNRSQTSDSLATNPLLLSTTHSTFLWTKTPDC